MNDFEIKLEKNDSTMWIAVIDNKIVLRHKDYGKLESELKKQFPNTFPTILNPPSETLVL